MENIDENLKIYIEEKIFPIYEQNDLGHNLEHIKYVINRSLKFARQFENLNINMVYVIASFHDVAHHIDKNKHEILSAKLFFENDDMKNFFNDEQRKLIKEAIEDHRASLEYEPRSIYGKIVSTADRNTDINSALKRTHSYTMKHYPDLSLEDVLGRAYKYISKKIGKLGYAKVYVKDNEFEKFKEEIGKLLNNKYLFSVKYMEVNEVMDLKERAKLFALEAHKDQIRKNEPDKPMIIHPISVGMLLEEYGYDDNIVAAGYLHDVVEDTKYTIDDIEKEFGGDIASLVMAASEPDKALSWEERKKHTIEEIKKLPLRSKLVICADKINNLEDLMLKFEKTGVRDFSAFKRGEEQQKWYYTSVYESLIMNENSDLAIFKRLKDVLDIVFYEKEDVYLRDTIFNNSDYYKKLKMLHAQKCELQRLRALCSLSKPFVIEFSGTPRTGKTTTINNLYDFFKKGGFKVSIIEEFTTSKYYKEQLRENISQMDIWDKHMVIMEEVYGQLLSALNTSNQDIILIDRSINDRQIWNYKRYISDNTLEKKYIDVRDKFSAISKDLIDLLVITCADSLTCIQRDYNCSLALEKRNFLNIDNVNDYNNCLLKLKELFLNSVENFILLDTTNMNMNDVSVQIASQVMPVMRKKYIKCFKDKYDLN